MRCRKPIQETLIHNHTIYLELLGVNQKAFETARFADALYSLYAALHLAVETKDVLKLRELKHRGEDQHEKVNEPTSSISWLELDNYDSFIRLVITHLTLLERRLGLKNELDGERG